MERQRKDIDLTSEERLQTGKKLKTLRKKRGWTQKNLANQMRIISGESSQSAFSVRHISRAENGSEVINVGFLDCMASALGTTLEEPSSNVGNTILGALANALYDPSKQDGQRLGRLLKRYEQLNALRCERLPEELKEQIEQYRLQTSQVGLIEIGKALHEVLEKDESLAADAQQLLTSTDDLKKIMEVGFSHLAESQVEIKNLIEQIPQSPLTIQIYQHDSISVDQNLLLEGIDEAVQIAVVSQLAAQKIEKLDTEIVNAFHKYKQSYINRHGQIKVFCVGMREPIPLEDVYVAVKFLNQFSIFGYRSIGEIESAYRESGNRRFQLTDDDKRQEGIAVANEKQYLMVLGGPGVGKSTFLRKVGLEALKGKSREFNHDCIPVFIELKKFINPEIDIKEVITNEFRVCRYPYPEQITTTALEQGKLLVLFDGLDEVPTANTDRVIHQISDFVNRYSDNRFIASCRIAAYKGGFTRFTEVEIADFDDEQIKSYINNWFASNVDPDRVALDEEMNTAKKCWEVLNSPAHQATKELAQNPLLLTMLCMVYDDYQSFPIDRGSLYDKALSILLERWAAEKHIQRESTLHRYLTIPIEQRMLAEIAAKGFNEDRLFFGKHELIEQIDGFRTSYVNPQEAFDGNKILQAIAIEQGLFVERATDVYSFSHLTLQEYLTAVYIAGDHRRIKALVTDYLLGDRWHEVFLLVAGVMYQADYLLEEMQVQANKLINTPKLENLLRWADGIIDRSKSNIKPFAKRAIAVMHALEYAIADADTYAIADAYAYAYAIADPYARADAIAYADARAYADAYADADAAPRADAYARAFASVNTNLGNSFNIFKGIDFASLIEKLDIFEAGIKQKQFKKESFDAIIKVWRDALNLTDDMIDLSTEEWHALDNYLKANELIIKCKEAAVRVSLKVWQEIEAGLLRVGE